MKSLMRLLECVLADAGIWCSTCTTHDFNTIVRRVEHEGISFLTITLPTFAQDLERGLETGRVDSTLFLSFKKRGSLPVFLRGLTSQVFDTSSGRLLEDASSLCIHAIRQICMMNKKLLLQCSKQRKERAYDSFLETDRSVYEFEENWSGFWTINPGDDLHPHNSREIPSDRGRIPNGTSPRSSVAFDRHSGLQPQESCVSTLPPMALHHFKSVAGILWGGLFDADSFGEGPSSPVPRHGPGATAERLSANCRYRSPRYHYRLDHWFPASSFVIPNSGYIDELEGISFVSPELEDPVRVVQVPKTLKSPRIIAIEPACMMYTQQALMEVLVDRLEKYDYSKGRVNFTDQTVNQQMALKSSETGRFATIDLKDASDRVSASLVWEMLASQVTFRNMVFACRSLRADVPGRGVIPLSRFASMGSALCFPIEAMVFYTIVVSAIHRAERLPLTPETVLKLSRSVRVYGDDIIVPVAYVQAVKDELEVFNLRVNVFKSFWTGKFRESCGLDAYNGMDVTPKYVRRMLPTSRHDTPEIISAVSLANQLYEAGYWTSCEYVRRVVERFATVPYSRKTSSVLGWFSYVYDYEIHGWDRKRHCWTVKGLVVASQLRRDPLEGWPALMKFFLKREGTPVIAGGPTPHDDVKHLERYGRPLSVYTKARWVQPY